MLCDFKHSTERVRLKIHPDKTKILSNQSFNQKKRSSDQQHDSRDSLRVKKQSIFGRQQRLSNRKTAEIKNRIRAAWASFYKYKQELTSKSYFYSTDSAFFNMVITPTLSNASGTCTLSREHERMIRSIQRKMLRLVVQTKRKYKNKTQPGKNEKDEEREKETTEDLMKNNRGQQLKHRSRPRQRRLLHERYRLRN